jgi:hypothetical protein
MAKTLAERMQEHERQKARLAEQEAKLKLAGRKERTRRLIEAGGLVEKAGLLDLEANALYGALLSLRESSDDKSQVAHWAALGGRAFAREAREREAGKEPVILTFPGPLPKEATSKLRAAGFRFSKVFLHWEGLARYDEAAELAKELGGAARRVGEPGVGLTPDAPSESEAATAA